MRRHHRILCAGLVIAGVLSAAADAVGQPVYEVLHHFAAPASGAKGKLLAASDGNMYGTTPIGGLHGAGTIFVLRPAASGGFTLETIHAFDGVDGRAPIAGLVEGSDGALYGTAPEGGTAGRGTIFKITTQGIFTLLHTFTGADGAAPQASLILGSDGNLYGTTLQGGTHNLGTVFRLTADDEVMTLHAFAGGDAGAYPVIPVVQGSGGDLFGMTAGRYGSLGGTNQATLFRMTLDGALTTLHVFTYQGMRPALGLTEGLDGSFYGAWVTSPIPVNAGFFRLTPDGAFDVIAEGHSSTVGLPLFGDAPMTRAADGSFYGTFSEAGAHGRGVAFRLTSAGELTVIHAFTPEEGASASGLVEVNGLLYGATIDGGAAGNGMVYSMTKGGVLQRVSQFLGGPAGVPVSAPVLGTDGNLYVTTSQGGSFEEGAVLRMTPDGVVDVLHVFNGADGAHPGASLVLANDGSFHGTTVKGGCHGLGTVFRISASGVFEVVHCFAPGEGAYPSAPLIQARDGNLYGTTVRGGASDAGTIFAVTPSGGFVTAYSFTPPIAFPVGPLLEASDGNYYGTTAGPGPGVGGAVYRFDQTGAQTVLALLQAESPGPIPFTSSRILGGVSEVGDGTMFAVACCGAHGNVVLRVRSTGGIANSTSLGAAAPANAPIRGLDDHFYGTASGGPSVSFGSLIYRMDAAGAIVEEKMIGHMDGDMAIGALLEVSAGVFYGTTARGGLSGRGVIFRITYP